VEWAEPHELDAKRDFLHESRPIAVKKLVETNFRNGRVSDHVQLGPHPRLEPPKNLQEVEGGCVFRGIPVAGS